MEIEYIPFNDTICSMRLRKQLEKMDIKRSVLWNAAPYSLVEFYRCFYTASFTANVISSSDIMKRESTETIAAVCRSVPFGVIL
jgi:hypothetical protein